MKKDQVDDALKCLWVIVRENSPIVIGSQALHGTHPDAADDLLYSREVDVILPNRAKLGNWLSEVVGEGTPFEADRGYYIDHVLAREGFPILAQGWEDRAISEPLISDGKKVGDTKYLSVPDLAISKLGAGREKDLVFVQKLIHAGYLALADVRALVEKLPQQFRQTVQKNLAIIEADLARDGV